MAKSRLLYLFLLLIVFTIKVSAQSNTPPSCVITSPHNNAYFQEGKAMMINVYSADIGGSSADGTVTTVEFYNGNTKIGDAVSHTSNTFSYLWKDLVAGSYTITAKATDNLGEVTTSAAVIVQVGTAEPSSIGLSACKGKYLANIVAGNIPSNFNSLWNGITAENNTKWGVVENTRNSMNWDGANIAYNHAKTNNLPFRYHAIAWGSQFPLWAINSSNQLLLTPAEFQSEVEEYMAAIATQFPDAIDQLDVLNENLRTHAPATEAFKTGLGGTGTTGHDWIIWLFTKARQYFPNSKLILNDYGLENDQSAINEQLKVIKLLRDRNLIDGFGTQAHEFNINTLTAAQLKSSLDLMTKGGVPIYVTELDISGDDNTQRTRYQTLFPVYWEHPAVAGITLWGYEAGKTWKANTQLLNNTGGNRPAMTWLKDYMSKRPDVGYPFCSQDSVVTAMDKFSNDEALIVYPNPSNGDFSFVLGGKFFYELSSISGLKLKSGSALDKLVIGNELSNGVYLLRVTQKGQYKTFKLNKQ